MSEGTRAVSVLERVAALEAEVARLARLLEEQRPYTPLPPGLLPVPWWRPPFEITCGGAAGG
jgi:hypothetical protein